jgi:spermidine/putrescine-binding protein
MNKMKTVLAGLVLAAVLVTSGCGESPEKKGELNFFNWTEYLPQSVLTAFEEEYNIKVNYSMYSSNEEMLAKVKSGEKGMYDLIIPSDYMIDIMRKSGDLEKIDRTKIPNFGNVDPQYTKMYFDPANEYSVPYMISNAILCYNRTKIPQGITSFGEIFDPRYKNQLVVLDDQRMVMAAAAIALGESINETDPVKLSVIKDKLFSLKENIKVFDSDSPKSQIISGETSIGYVWCAEAALAMQENPNIIPVYPTEGLALMFDNLAIPAGAKNKENALLFINFILRPEISKMISAEYPYVNPNKAAYAILPDSYKNNPASNPPAKALEKGQFVMNLGDSAQTYDDIWTEFKNQ